MEDEETHIFIQEVLTPELAEYFSYFNSFYDYEDAFYTEVINQSGETERIVEFYNQKCFDEWKRLTAIIGNNPYIRTFKGAGFSPFDDISTISRETGIPIFLYEFDNSQLLTGQDKEQFFRSSPTFIGFFKNKDDFTKIKLKYL